MTAVATPPVTDATLAPRRRERVVANLMPDEVLVGRRLSRLKRRLALAMAILVVLVAAFYAWSWWQTGKADDELSAAQDRTATLQQSQRSFAPLVAAKAGAAQIQLALQGAMADDLRWADLLQRLDKAAPQGISITGVSASVTGAAANTTGGAPTTPGDTVLNRTGLASVGTLTVSGTAKDKASLASFVDGVSRIDGIAGAYPANLAGQSGAYTFTVNGVLTSAALGGRFSAPSPTAATTTPGVK